jgi:hypothetical protein
LDSDSWDDIPDAVKLSPAEMPWLVASAGVLQPLGKARVVREAPDACFQSGRNLYCADQYELATVSHYHVERLNEKQLTQVSRETSQSGIGNRLSELLRTQELRRVRAKSRWAASGIKAKSRG